MSERTELEAEDLGEGMAFRTSPAPPSAATGDTSLSLVEAERRHIEAVVRAQAFDVPAAAKVLGVSRSTLYEKIKKHGLTLPPARS